MLAKQKWLDHSANAYSLSHLEPRRAAESYIRFNANSSYTALSYSQDPAKPRTSLSFTTTTRIPNNSSTSNPFIQPNPLPPSLRPLPYANPQRYLFTVLGLSPQHGGINNRRRPVLSGYFAGKQTISIDRYHYDINIVRGFLLAKRYLTSISLGISVRSMYKLKLVWLPC